MIVSVLVAGTAQAESAVLSPDEAALLASEVHGTYCADAAAGDPETEALAIERAAPAYGKVAASYRTHGNAFLLYWRGLLAQCLSKEEEAVSDLEGFAAAASNDPAYRPQVADARRRLRRLTAGQDPTRPEGPQLSGTLGIAVAGSGVAFVALSLHLGAYEAAEFDVEANLWTGEPDDYGPLSGVNRLSVPFVVGGGITAAVGTVLSIAVGARDHRTRVGAAIVPTDGGFHASMVGRW